MKKIIYTLKYNLRELRFIKALFSPFKPFHLKFYCGEKAIGTPYFFPRKWIKSKEKPGYLTAVPKKIGFSYCSLGWKTKWTNTDYRFEWSPVLSFVFFKWQIAVTVCVEHTSEYWESWLYYENDTDKTKSRKERIKQCIKEFPQTYKQHYSDDRKETIDYYKLILKTKYTNI